ncbi:hypothetical protein [Amycolatopsis lurida]|uniref:hypothetical protein n=1 Tax=Amycolatopsis lurida TaxID=31959 RepID=UPI00364C8DEC
MPHPYLPRVTAVIAGCLLPTASALVTACSSPHVVPGTTPYTATVEEQELAIPRQRPDIAVARFEHVLNALRDALSAQLHWGPWDRSTGMRQNSPPTSCARNSPPSTAST